MLLAMEEEEEEEAEEGVSLVVLLRRRRSVAVLRAAVACRRCLWPLARIAVTHRVVVLLTVNSMEAVPL